MGLLDRLFGKKQSPAPTPASGSPAAASFAVGDRVRNPWGQTGVVKSVDPAANHGLGRLVVQMDDGTERTVALMAPGFERVGEGG